MVRVWPNKHDPRHEKIVLEGLRPGNTSASPLRMHGRIQRGDMGPEPPPPLLKNHKNIEFLSNTGPDPLKFPKLPNQIQYWTIIGTPAKHHSIGRVAQSVTCLATDACLTADPGVASSIPARSHTFVEIDHEIISTVILLPSADLFKKGCCQFQAKVCARITG